MILNNRNFATRPGMPELNQKLSLFRNYRNYFQPGKNCFYVSMFTYNSAYAADYRPRSQGTASATGVEYRHLGDLSEIKKSLLVFRFCYQSRIVGLSV